MGSKKALWKAFGKHLRRTRVDLGISLRRCAAGIHVSPAYLSKVERGEIAPPSEAKIRLLALSLQTDTAELLHLAGRVPGDVSEMIRSDAKISKFVFELSQMSPAQRKKLYELTKDQIIVSD